MIKTALMLLFGLILVALAIFFLMASYAVWNETGCKLTNAARRSGWVGFLLLAIGLCLVRWA